MTVAARRGAAAPAAPLAADLRSMLAASRRAGDRALVALTRQVPSVDPIGLFAAARAQGLEAVLWLQPEADRSIVGIGRAWSVEPDGPDRFSMASAAWTRLVAGARRSGATTGAPEAGPMLLGGLGFGGSLPQPDDAWAPFKAASLVLPTFGLLQDGPRSGLTIAVGPDQLDQVDPGAIEREWTGFLADAAVRVDASPVPTILETVDERPGRADWDRTVGQYAGAVGRGRIDKVVLARRVAFQASADLDVVAALRHLAATAPESTTFAFVRGGTTFLGATPERLARTAGRRFETMAVAGSAARGANVADDQRLASALLVSEKDHEEHAVVVDTLRRDLTPITNTLEIAAAPSILPLRHVQHLVTPVRGTLRDDAGLLAVAYQLHPTPAVGGAPRETALAMIDEYEGFDRGWYAGPIGWLGADGDGELMVALRCGLVAGRQATLFAGCGIVADSDPAREWDESRLKLRTMLAALGGGAGTATENRRGLLTDATDFSGPAK